MQEEKFCRSWEVVPQRRDRMHAETKVEFTERIQHSNATSKKLTFEVFLKMLPFLIRILLSSGRRKRMSSKSKHNVFVYLARREADGVERWSDDKIAKRSR